MAEHGPLGSAYVGRAEKFNAGDTDAWGELLADDCVFDAVGGRFGSSSAEIIGRLKKARQRLGWLRHEVIATMEDGDVVAVIARNTFDDGTTLPVAGCMRFRDGRIVELRSAGGIPE
jgi:ketosteroid isomerase-like protein